MSFVTNQSITQIEELSKKKLSKSIKALLINLTGMAVI